MNEATLVIILAAILTLNCASARRLNTNFAELQCISEDCLTAKHWSIQVEGSKHCVHGRLHTEHEKVGTRKPPRTRPLKKH